MAKPRFVQFLLPFTDVFFKRGDEAPKLTPVYQNNNKKTKKISKDQNCKNLIIPLDKCNSFVIIFFLSFYFDVFYNKIFGKIILDK